MMDRRKGEAGYAMAVLLITATVVLIMLTAAVPSWRYVAKDTREEELLFRGGDIADAIQRFQRKNGNALPVSLDQLVKGKYLRKAHKDPMTADGKWRFIRQGELLPQQGPGLGVPGMPGQGSAFSGLPGANVGSPGISMAQGSAGSAGARSGMPVIVGGPETVVGPFIGVASTSADKSIRVFNNREHYGEWFFVVGQPRVVGNQPMNPVPRPPGAPAGPVGPGTLPGMQPLPGPARPPS